jgi:hypothetical protein
LTQRFTRNAVECKYSDFNANYAIVKVVVQFDHDQETKMHAEDAGEWLEYQWKIHPALSQFHSSSSRQAAAVASVLQRRESAARPVATLTPWALVPRPRDADIFSCSSCIG